MAVTNREASVLAKLKNQAKSEGVSYQMALQLFFQEEFLRRLSFSKYRKNLVLKGGMFIYTLTKFDSRPTRDMDFLILEMSNELDNVRSVMEEICAEPTGNDYILIDVIGTERITLDKKYPGVKTKLMGRIKNVRVPFSIDVGVDDVIIPEAVVRQITTRLEGFIAPEIYTYSLESTIAEKVDAIFDRMETTSRMKDYYDIYYLSNMFDFKGDTLAEAFRRTLEHRNRVLNKSSFERIAEFGTNQFLNIQWNAFEPASKSALSFQKTIDRIHDFIEPVVISIMDGTVFLKKWSCKAKEWL